MGWALRLELAFRLHGRRQVRLRGPGEPMELILPILAASSLILPRLRACPAHRCRPRGVSVHGHEHDHGHIDRHHEHQEGGRVRLTLEEHRR